MTIKNLRLDRNWISKLPEAIQIKILSVSSIKKLSKGQALFELGSNLEYLYQLVEGKIELRTPSKDGAYHLHDIYCSGDCFAELQFITAHPSITMAVAKSDCKVRLVPYAELTGLQQLYPEINVELLKVLAIKLKLAKAFFSNQSTQLLPAKLATRLYYEMKVLKRASDSNENSELSITQENLADMLGSSRDSISRILGQWSKEKIIELHYGRIVLMDAECLLKQTHLPELDKQIQQI